jgi:hypothetical protein
MQGFVVLCVTGFIPAYAKALNVECPTRNVQRASVSSHSFDVGYSQISFP